jgi:hypothetical protein
VRADARPQRRPADGCLSRVFHFPLLTITTIYQSAGSRWIIVPMVMVTITLAGVWYGWLRLRYGTIWPVSLSHSGFNHFGGDRGWRGDRHLARRDGLHHNRNRLVTLIIVLALAIYLSPARPGTSAWIQLISDLGELMDSGPGVAAAIGQ